MGFLHQWVILLVEGQTEKALAMVRNHPIQRKDFGLRKWLVKLGFLAPIKPFQWTPALIENLIAGYGSMDSSLGYQVTPPEQAKAIHRRQSLINSLKDPDIYGAVHDKYPYAVFWDSYSDGASGNTGWATLTYPLNGEWSDLKSEFYLYRTEQGIEIELHRIECM